MGFFEAGSQKYTAVLLICKYTLGGAKTVLIARFADKMANMSSMNPYSRVKLTLAFSFKRNVILSFHPMFCM